MEGSRESRERPIQRWGMFLTEIVPDKAGAVTDGRIWVEKRVLRPLVGWGIFCCKEKEKKGGQEL